MHSIKKSILPLRMHTPVFGLRIGSRGTPWNSKSAGPGGSDFTKCQKVPFIWHFGLFRVFVFFDIFHFSDFAFCHFFCFSLFAFCWFLCFSDFLDFVDFGVFVNFSDFLFFHSFSLFFNFSKGILKIRPSFDLFCPPSSTPMASTWGGSFLNGEILLLFLLAFSVFWLFFDDFWWFFDFAIKNRDFLINFSHFFWSFFCHFFWFFSFFWLFFEFYASFLTPLNPRQ